MRFNTLFVVLSAVSALAAPIKRSVSTVKADLADIDFQLTAIDVIVTDKIASINHSLQWNYVCTQVYYFDLAAGPLETSVKKVTADIQTTTAFSEDDGKRMLTSFRELRDVLGHTLPQLAFKAEVVKKLEERNYIRKHGRIRQDIVNLGTAFSDFADALVAKFPPNLASQATPIKENIETRFARVIAAYSQP
ncbi:hypothetical protein AAF712_014150 [Marasmius tenuissimus]|uniref:Cell wall protein n=1 Tax=Marasmius tenuissimus TaxID=585030 RepID=A0ABR2ZBR9_9AGAR